MLAHTLSQLDAEVYLQHIEVLSGELSHAMDAMVAHELPAFEQSLIRQRNLCANLEALPQRAAQDCLLASSPASPPADQELQGRIQQATLTLKALNLRYSALLEHSGDTLKLFAGLLRSYSGPAQAQGMQAGLRTWSCEI